MLADPAFHLRDQRVVNRVMELIDEVPASPTKDDDDDDDDNVEASAPLINTRVIRAQLESSLYVRVLFPSNDVAQHMWNSLGFRSDLIQPTPETLLLEVPTDDAVRYRQIMHALSAVPDVAIESMTNVIAEPPEPPMAPVPSVIEKKRERRWDQSFSSSQSS